MSASSKTVGIIGLGIMGGAISKNLSGAGWHVIGFDLDQARCAEAKAAGVEIADGVVTVAQKAEHILVSLPNPYALKTTVDALVAGKLPRRVIAELSTFSLDDKTDAETALRNAGHVLLDCPLSGTGAQARAKDLVVYASGDKKGFDKAKEFLPGFSRAHYYLGEFGNGSKMKFVANLMVAIHNVSAAEAFVLGMKSGLSPEDIYKVAGDGAGASRMFQVRGPMMVKGDYSEATMKNEVWQKDMTIIGDFARELDCPTPLFAASAPIYNAAMAMGLGKEDTGAVCAVLEKMAGSPRKRMKRSGR